jgi:hypothetical protein
MKTVLIQMLCITKSDHYRFIQWIEIRYSISRHMEKIEYYTPVIYNNIGMMFPEPAMPE